MKKKIKEKLSRFPHEPGVYLFKDASGRHIYIGKARDLWKRMRSYIYGRDDRPLVQALLQKADDADFIMTSNEKEALILENTLIKKFQPVYNIDLKDDKNFHSIMIDRGHPYPGIRLVRKIDKKKEAEYFGPYHSSKEIREIIRFMTSVFPVRTCSDNVFRNRKRPCIRYEIEKCSGPCCGRISRKDYLVIVSQFTDFLKGRNKSLMGEMKKEIKAASGKLEFERAGFIHTRMKALEGMFEKQSVVFHKGMHCDAWGIAVSDEKGAILLQNLHIRHGLLVSQERKLFFKRIGHLQENLESFFFHYYKNDPAPPEWVLVPLKIDAALVGEELSRLHGRRVKFMVPRRGKKKEILDMAARNAQCKLQEELAGRNSADLFKKRIKKKLSLKNSPTRIECFDISNIQGTDSVASRVCFIDFRSETSEYRKYSLHDIAPNDDYLKMASVIRRRILKGSETGIMPDLIIIDGGSGHLQAVYKMLRDITHGVDLIAIAKDKSRGGTKEDKIYIIGRKNPLVFQSFERDILFQIMKIRDEAHRFAVKYHRWKRKKRYLGGMENGKSRIENGRQKT